MKVFIFAVVAMALCLAFVIAGTLYTASAIERLRSGLEELPRLLPKSESTPEDILEGVENAINIWSSASKMTLLGVSHSDYDEVEGLLVSLRTAALCGESGSYANFVAALEEKLKRLAISEGFSLDGVL